MKFKTIILTVLVLALAFVGMGCGDKPTDPNSVTKLSFKDSNSYDTLKKLNNTTVTINGYMATSSPVDGSFIFLMNLPYQSCPFCKPNTSELSNTIEAYPKKGQTFNYTEQAIRVTGTLKVASKGETFTDKYGYEFSFKIVDAEYTIIKDTDLDGDAVLRTKVANAGIVTEMYKMFDYLNFCCRWNTYYYQTSDTSDPNYPGFYLYASDALQSIKTSGAQYNYGYVSSYFDDLITMIHGVSETDLEDLVAVVNKSKALAAKAIKELEDGNYTYEYKYVEKFDKNDYIFTLNKEQELVDEYESIYYAFSDWYGM